MADPERRLSVAVPGGEAAGAPRKVVRDGFEIGLENDRKLAEAWERIEALRQEGRLDTDAELQALVSFAERYAAAKERAFDAFVQAAEQS